MRRYLFLIVALVLSMTGCTWGKSEMNHALALRETVLMSNGCSFQTVITADYSDQIYTFEMECTTDKEGNLTFCVIRPESISGITGIISRDSGKLTFDDKALLFETLADGQVTPVSAPWFVINALRSGYIQSCGKSKDGLYIQIDDSYEEKSLSLDYYLDQDGKLIRAEIIWEGRRILSMDVENFTIL